MTPPTIRLLVLDVDGVLTDGSIIYDSDGREIKHFNVRDGLGIRIAMEHGLSIAIATARSSAVVSKRAAELGIEHVEQGATSKRIALGRICDHLQIALSDTAYIGDDLADLSALSVAGYPMAVADAVPQVRQIARYVTHLPGGRGAVREAIEHLLQLDGRWDQALATFTR